MSATSKSQHDYNLQNHEFYGTNKAPNTDVAICAMARVANNLMIVILGLSSFDISTMAILSSEITCHIGGLCKHFICLHDHYSISTMPINRIRLEIAIPGYNRYAREI